MPLDPSSDERDVDERRRNSRNHLGTVALLIAVCALHFLRFGFDFGSSDQDELIPAVLHATDGDILASDWYVATQAAEFNVRTPVVWLVALLARPLGVAGATALLHTLSLMFIAFALVRLVRVFTKADLAAAVAVLLLVVLTPRFTLGGNDLTHSVFVPSTLAWVFCILGFTSTLSHEPVRAGVLFGMAVWVQPLVGILVSITVCAGVFFAQIGRSQTGAALRRALVCGGVAVSLSLPVLIPIVTSQLNDSGVSSDVLYHILVNVRAPHHYLPSSYPSRSFLQFGILVLAGTTSIVLAPTLRSYRRELLFIMGTIACFCVVYFVAVEFGESLGMAKLQVFKLTVLAKVIAGVAVSVSMGEAVTESSLGRRFARALQPRVATVFAVGLAATTAIAAASGNLNSRIGYLERAHSPRAELYDWARTNTPQDAIFAVPPSNSEMRSWSRRAIVVNFKAFPFQDALMIEWHRRLRDMSNNPGLDSGFVALADLDASYEALADIDLISLSNRYGFSYIVRRSPIAVTDSTHPGWANVASFGGSSMSPAMLYVYRRELSQSPVR